MIISNRYNNCLDLHSNMELLLYNPYKTMYNTIIRFTFQYGATSMELWNDRRIVENTFTFQYGATSIREAEWLAE